MTIAEFIREYGIVQAYIVNRQEIKTVSDNPSDKFWNMLIGVSGEIMFFVDKVKPIEDGLRSELEAEFKNRDKSITAIKYVSGLNSIQVVFTDGSFSVSKKYGYIKLNNGKFYWYKNDEMISGKMYDAEGDYYIKIGDEKYSIMAKEKYNIKEYMTQIPNLKFNNINDEIWEVIETEGMDEEFDSDRSNWSMAVLNISEDDKNGLIKFDNEIVNKFNVFDIRLKDKYNMKYIDLIDYDNGIIRIVKYDEKI